MYKVLVIGDYAVGKTSIIKRYCEGFFTPNYKLTVGVDFAVKDIQIENSVVTLQLWDVAGHERFGNMTRVYYKYAIAAVVVYDLSRPATFEAVLKWRDDVHSKVILRNNEPVPLILLANKCDLPGVNVDTKELDEFCAANGFKKWFQTSAQNNTNIDEAMMYLMKMILEVSKTNRPEGPPPDHIQIELQPPSTYHDDSVDIVQNCCN
uniref:Ras-related protein Rab n=1 Tax=Arcella intermedia TaxID=1963864 RepID=A0A6B2LI58_9EUKA